ncbi:MAG TPA: hypothetical protein VNW97_01485 [Candidatus Saccharimonadales bacterium]|jgi:hypothetical protein|nr:hypothetical protein [Candidatus Saccharimonadales bacterium]
MWRIFAIGSLAALLTGRALAQNTQPSELDTIKALLQEVADLKARVAALEARHEQPVTGEAANAPAVEPPKQPEVAPSESNAEFGVFRGIKFAGFGALSFKASDARPPESALLGFRDHSSSSFAVGDTSLFITSHLNSKASVLGEITFSETAEQGFEIDVERLLLKYELNDYLKLSFGRYHTAVSYYNQVFHHGQWLQTAVDRPLVVEFSDHGGLLPSQAVGVSVTGQVPSGHLGLNYILEYGTSDTHRPTVDGSGSAEIEEDNGQSTIVGLFARPDGLPGLEAGGSFYHDRIQPNGGPLHMGQSVVSAHVVYVTPRYEFINEGFVVQHNVQETGQTFNTPAFYSLISAKLGGRWRPYFRYQYVNANSPVFPDVKLRHGPSAGLRYELNDYVALKAQIDRTLRSSLAAFNALNFQLAFRF